LHWDLTEEHCNAYNEKECQRIDGLTDLFDLILDYMYSDHGLYPGARCVDVFPCTAEGAETGIPKGIRHYYDMYLDEKYRNLMKKKYQITLALTKMAEGTIEDILGIEFALRNMNPTWKGTEHQNKENIKATAFRLKNLIGADTAILYSLSRQDLKILEETYLGILFDGSVIQYGDIAILSVYGTNE
jgi:hypothetical protein